MSKMLTCVHCGANVGEESCGGCREARLSYKCSKCGGIVPNPRYRSGVICQNCGEHVVEQPKKQLRQYQKFYICNHCEAIVPNPRYQRDHSCAGCKPPTCEKCGGRLAWSPVLDYTMCESCGEKYPVE